MPVLKFTPEEMAAAALDPPGWHWRRALGPRDDEGCRGFCRCPTCGGGAHWWPAGRIHACADPKCAHEFRDHSTEGLERAKLERLATYGGVSD